MNSKDIFTLLGDWIIIRSVGEIKEIKSKIITPNQINPESYQNHKKWLDAENFIYALGNKVENENLVFGAKVLLVPHAPLRRIEEITKIVEDKTGVKFSIQQKDGSGKVVDGLDKQTEMYFAVKEENIISIIK